MGLRKLMVSIALFALIFFAAHASWGGLTPLYAKDKAFLAHPPLRVAKSSHHTVSGLQPAQVRKAYGIDKLKNQGKGQTIAIVDAFGSPTIENDLKVFSKQFGLPVADLEVAYPDGKPKSVDGGWALETALDVEWAHSIAPKAKILLVVAKTNDDNYLLNAIDYATKRGAQVVSNSWGGDEFDSERSYDSHFQGSRTVYLASSGDSGAGTEWPASSPSVVAVGGTSLHINGDGSYVGEDAWNGSGGGKSRYEPRSAYQNNWSSVVGSKRGIPDVSFVADPATGAAVYSTTKYQGQSGWFVVGGTSLSSPCYAALVALADEGRSTAFNSASLLKALYNVAGKTNSKSYKANFHDITTGDNGGYSAKPGYDLVTGLGSPQANNLIDSLVKQ